MFRVLLLIALASTTCIAGERPNVLLVIADDLRPQLGCYGDDVVHSPHFDAFAKKALRFDRAYVQSAICSPSRNSFLSGLRPNTTGLRGFGVKLREHLPDVVTLPQHFKNHGYKTRGFGKIFHVYVESMLGHENDPLSWSQPLRLPQQPVWGPEQNALRNQLIAEARKAGKEFNHPHDYPRARALDDSDVPDDQMQDGETTAHAIEFLKSHPQDEPFFLAVGFVRPHLPFVAPKKYWDLYDAESLSLPEFRRLPAGAPQWSVTHGINKNYYQMLPFDQIGDDYLRRYTQGYLACTSYVDACFGRLTAALDELGLADNTVVVFLGDHGYQLGEYDSWGHKHSNFEISTRIPLLVRAPQMTQVGRGSAEPVEALDLFPTLCELAGLPTPDAVEGASFAKLLTEAGATHKGYAVSEMQRGPKGRRKFIGRSIRTSDHRLTQWRMWTGKLMAEELYDHRSDAKSGTLEKQNVIDDSEYVDVLPTLRERLVKTVPHEGGER